MDGVDFSLVIPMYNEAAIIAETMRSVEDWFSANFPSGEALFIDDGSLDSTRRLADETASGCPHVVVSGYDKNRGKGGAVRFGMLMARGDVIAFTDCDLAYGLDILTKFYETNLTCGVCIGSRALHPDGYAGYSPARRLMSKCYLALVKICAGFKYSDSQTGVKSFSNAAAKRIFSDERSIVNGFAFDLEALMLAETFGCKIVEIPVKIINHRPSHINFVRDTLKMLREIFAMRRRIRRT